jgi:hypothetical protein
MSMQDGSFRAVGNCRRPGRAVQRSVCGLLNRTTEAKLGNTVVAMCATERRPGKHDGN